MAWEITATQDEASFFEEHIRQLLASNPTPPPEREIKLGDVELSWEEIEPKTAFIRAIGGTPDDRLLARKYLLGMLHSAGYRPLTWSLDDPVLRRLAKWPDVENNAAKLVQNGDVRLLRNGFENIVSKVNSQTTPGQKYDVEIFRQDPSSRAITGSTCTCGWGEFQNLPRTREFKQFQDRPCKHILATYWQSQATPTDEEAYPGDAGGAGQMSLFSPNMGEGGLQAPASMGLMQNPAGPAGASQGQQMPLEGFSGMMPGGPQGAGGGPSAPSGADVLPQFPMGGTETVNPASVPGLRQPTPTNPVVTPGTFSSWQMPSDQTDTFIRMADEAFTGQLNLNNSDLVQLRYPDTGTLVGRSEAHGAGQDFDLTPGMVGEVRGTDPTTGMVNVLYTGKPFEQFGAMEPFGASAWHWPSYLIPRPDLKKPGPAIRRTRP